MSLDNGTEDLLGGNDDTGFFGEEQAGPDLFGDEVAVTSSAPDVAEPAPVERPERVAAEAYAKPQTDGYVVLARKYRPQTFDDIVGQQAVQQGLRGAISTGQISHAYLFSGPRGTGKTSTARILAKALNCQDNGPRPDPCGKCASCRAITAGSSLDVIEIDAASNTGVDNIRELKSGVVLAPFSRYKVYIVDEVHMLSNQAFNALLKTLEEPPSQVIFVLATTELHKVPETIISRCQTFMFRRFSLEELKSQLGNILDLEAKQRGLSVEPEDREKVLDLVARNAEGGMRDAQVTLDQVLVLSKGRLDFESVRRFLGMADLEALDNFVRLIYARKGKELLELIDTLVAQGQDLELFVKGACEYLRDLMLVKCAGKDTSLINVSEDRALELEQVSGKLSAPFLINTIDHFLKVAGEMKLSGQPRTVLELSVLKLALADNQLNLEDLANRLSALEEKVQSGVPAGNTGGVAPQSRPVQSSAPAPSARVASEEPAQKKTSVEDDIAPSAALPLLEGSVVSQIAEKLKEGNGMLALSFEQAVSAVTVAGKTLTLVLDPAQGISVAKLQQPQSAAVIVNAARQLFGDDVMVRIEVGQAGSGSSGPSQERHTPERPVQRDAVREAVPARQQVATPTPVDAVASDVAGSAPEEDFSDEEQDLKIYYPDEIREKAMVEMRPAEFQELLKSDNNLRALVDKAKQVFGIEDSQLKYHRSTLA